MLTAIAVGGYRWLRYLAGYRKFRGTWYTEAQLGQIVQATWEDQQRGQRVLRADEIALLRQWQGLGRGIGLDQRNTYI